jgi:hypothetical protein
MLGCYFLFYFQLDRSALHIAALVGDRQMVSLLVKVDSKDIDARDMVGRLHVKDVQFHPTSIHQ